MQRLQCKHKSKTTERKGEISWNNQLPQKTN